MPDFIYLMHNDVNTRAAALTKDAWYSYIEGLRKQGCFRGGSEIGDGKCVRQNAKAPDVNAQLVGYMLIQADNLGEAEALLAGHPVFEAGGTVEIRALPQSG